MKRACHNYLKLAKKKSVERSIDTLMKNGWVMTQTLNVSYEVVGKGKKKRLKNFQHTMLNDRMLHAPAKHSDSKKGEEV